MEEVTLTIRKKHPCRDENEDDDRLSKRYLRHPSTIEHVGPIFRREDLIHGEKGIENLAKINSDVVAKVSPQHLYGDQPRDVVDNHEEKCHVG